MDCKLLDNLHEIFIAILHSIRSHGLGPSYDKALSCRLHDLHSHPMRCVKFHDSRYLGKQSAQQTKVPTADADDRSDSFFIDNGFIQGRHGAMSAPLLLQDPARLAFCERAKLVYEANSGIELRVSGESLLKSGHADEHEADASLVKDCTQLFESRHLQAVRLVVDISSRNVP